MRLAKSLAAAMLLAAGPALAGQDFACAPWQPAGQAPDLSAVSVLKSTLVVTAGAAPETIRMMQGTLTRRVYPDETGLYVLHGDMVRTDNGPGFGPSITVQRLVHDPDHPTLLLTTCEASR